MEILWPRAEHTGSESDRGIVQNLPKFGLTSLRLGPRSIPENQMLMTEGVRECRSEICLGALHRLDQQLCFSSTPGGAPFSRLRNALYNKGHKQGGVIKTTGCPQSSNDHVAAALPRLHEALSRRNEPQARSTTLGLVPPPARIRSGTHSLRMLRPNADLLRRETLSQGVVLMHRSAANARRELRLLTRRDAAPCQRLRHPLCWIAGRLAGCMACPSPRRGIPPRHPGLEHHSFGPSSPATEIRLYCLRPSRPEEQSASLYPQLHRPDFFEFAAIPIAAACAPAENGVDR